jgi:hypothetical protein
MHAAGPDVALVRRRSKRSGQRSDIGAVSRGGRKDSTRLRQLQREALDTLNQEARDLARIEGAWRSARVSRPGLAADTPARFSPGDAGQA